MQPWLELGDFKLGGHVEDYGPTDPQELSRHYQDFGRPSKPYPVNPDTRRLMMRLMLLKRLWARGIQITPALIHEVATREIAPDTTFDEAFEMFLTIERYSRCTLLGDVP